MREIPTSVAPVKARVPTYHLDSGHHIWVSLLRAAANANAAVVCPEGND